MKKVNQIDIKFEYLFKNIGLIKEQRFVNKVVDLYKFYDKYRWLSESQQQFVDILIDKVKKKMEG